MSTETSAPAGREAADGAAQMAQQVAGQAQERAQQAAGQAQSRLREQLDQRSSQAAEQINSQASDLRAVSQSLREQGKEGPASAADRLAGYAEKVGGYLRDRNSDALLSDAEDFGRGQPMAVGAGALALGFAASRFLKASSGRRYSSRSGSDTQPLRPGGAPTSGMPVGPPPPAIAPPPISSPAIPPAPGAGVPPPLPPFGTPGV